MLYIITFTRLDISFAVSRLSQFMHSPTYVHLTVVKRILRYVYGSLSVGLHFKRSSVSLLAFSDFDWAGNRLDRRSTTGFVIYLGSNPISWMSKKQTMVSSSSTEAEYRALAATTIELSWVRQILKDLFVYLLVAPILLCDNQFALQLARNLVFHGRTKHFEVDFHFVREKVASKDIQLQFISSVNQPADLFTKPLTTDHLRLLTNKLMPFSTFV